MDGRWVRFQVQEPDGKPLFISPVRWVARHRTEFYWDAQDRIWVLSSDVGTSVWAPEPGGPDGALQWRRLAPRDGRGLGTPRPIPKHPEQLSAPPPLGQELRPARREDVPPHPKKAGGAGGSSPPAPLFSSGCLTPGRG